jgi:hypothetical protein
MANISVDVAQTLNITCRKGDSFLLDITVTDSGGTSIDLTGYAGALIVKDNDGNTQIEFYTNLIADRTIDDSYSSGGHGLITMNYSASNDNTIRFHAQPTTAGTTNDLVAGTYNYDFAVEYESGDSTTNAVTTWLKGTFTVNADV